jgi:hypothetical protein
LIRGLQILNSSIHGSRDLWWPRDPFATRGYHVYRAFTAPLKWELLTPFPIPGQNYRDQTKLQTVRFLVTPEAFVDNGSFGMKCIRIPDIPYSEVVKGRPTVAINPDAVTVEITNNDKSIAFFRPKMVSGIDQLVWLEVGDSLPYGGAVAEFPVIDFDNVASITIIYRKLVNFVDIMTNMVRTFYVVVPVGDRGEEHGPGHPDAKVVDSLQIDELDYIFKHMVAYNAWIFEQVGEPAHLMFRRTSGDRCGCGTAQDFTQARTACPSCFETGIIGGYYGPVDFLFQDPDSALTRTLDEGGTKVERKSRSYLGRTPIVQDGDMIVRINGERLVISGVTYKMPRGVLVQQEFDVALLPTKDTRYGIPLFEPENPVIFNPASQDDPGHGAQPVFQTDTVPGKGLEHPNKPVGRTVTFGRIMGT